MSRHNNKLRTGHLRGNRFVLGIVGSPPGGDERARALLARLAERGLLNVFGAQRFGRDGENLATGLAWLRGETALPRGRERFLTKLYASAVQSEAFNRYAIARAGIGLERPGHERADDEARCNEGRVHRGRQVIAMARDGADVPQVELHDREVSVPADGIERVERKSDRRDLVAALDLEAP